MGASAMKLPDASHPIAITRHGRRVVVTFAGQTIADTRRALRMTEAKYPPVFYIPLADVHMAHLVGSTHKSYCPYKGDCSYYSLSVSGETSENAVWTYERPYPSVAEIAGHVAFYPERVSAIGEAD